MTDFVHIYTAKGRCVGSQKFGDHTLHPEVAATDATRLQFQLFAQGYRLTLWNPDERAGLLIAGDETFIARIKSVDLCRDMRAGGAQQTMAAVRAGAVEIEPITGLTPDKAIGYEAMIYRPLGHSA